MQLFRSRAAFKFGWVVFLFIVAQPAALWAQQSVLVAALRAESVEPMPTPTPIALVAVPLPEARPHRFWDNENRALFVTVAAFSAADFAVTRANLAHNGTELNPVTRIFSGSTAGLAANFSLETGGVIGAAYLLHKSGHHKLERMISFLNIGASGAAVSYDLAHH